MKRICAWCSRELESGRNDNLEVTHGLCPDCRYRHFSSSRSTDVDSGFAIRNILVPIDWSPPSKQAFRLADSLAHQHNAKITLVYVVPLATVLNGPTPENYLTHLRDQLRLLEPSSPDIQTDYVVTEGIPAVSILETARDFGCDLIVMGTHGRTGMSRLLMGSVAEEVVRKAPCPVLTLRLAATPACLESARLVPAVAE
jgi:nucleotide-binding universal stress UspA family protein